MKEQERSKAEEVKRRVTRDRIEDTKAKAMLIVGILKSTDRDAKGDVR
jgi:hypothetical protein